MKGGIKLTKDEYRSEISKHSAYITMKELLRDMQIDPSNYYAFMSGDDRRLGAKACERIIEALQRRPISPN